MPFWSINDTTLKNDQTYVNNTYKDKNGNNKLTTITADNKTGYVSMDPNSSDPLIKKLSYAIQNDGKITYLYDDGTGNKVQYNSIQEIANGQLQGYNAATTKRIKDAMQNNLTKSVNDYNTKNPTSKVNQNDATKQDESGEGSKPVDLDIKDSGQSRNKKDSFGSYTYPLDIANTKQDVVKFTMLKYEPRKFQTGQGNLGGFADRTKNRTRLGTVVLPIPSGISETNGVNWGSDTMDPGQALLANMALSGITKGMGAMVDEGAKALEAASKSGDVQVAVAAGFAQAASQVGGLLTRTQGTVLNPNMELLFNAPTLRPFNFTFKMSARNSKEAKQIIQIIRFFKQGMSPQKSDSNLYLKSPHTFNINYLHRPSGADADHPYIGAIKECALQNFVVNYTPEGQYATFNDGVLVSYEIQMTFQELEPIFNEDYGNSGSSMPADLLFSQTTSSKP